MRAAAVMIAAVLASLPLVSQTNDSCATATPITEGVLVLATNFNATTGPDPVACAATKDVWFAITLSCGAQYVASTCGTGTSFDTVLSVWNGAAGCGALTLVGCNDNNCALPGGLSSASRVTFTAAAGGLYYISVGGKTGLSGNIGLRVDLVTVMSLGFVTSGPGTLGYHVTGPASGWYFLAVTLTPGAFPFGWFYGVDIPLGDLVAQYNSGFPFTGSFSSCGSATVGPFGGLPTGLTVYAVALGFSPGASQPGFTSNPATGTVP